MREMKDSGVEWIGEIPADWNVGKTLYALSMPITDGPHETPELFEEGIPFVSAEAVSCGNGHIDFEHIRGFISQDFYDECCKKYIPEMHDIYMIKSGATTGKVAKVETEKLFTIWSPLAVFRTNPKKCFYEYLYYFIQSDAYQKQIENKWTYGTQQNIGMRTLEKLMICFPSIDQQMNIAGYLDVKCSKIDEIIEKQLSIIEKLKEYKLSIITEAVTSGINPDVEMKDSGSVWFGSIPINWQMNRLKYVFHIQKDIAGEEGHTVLSITQRGIIPKDFSNNEGQFANSYANYQLVHKGDFAMNHMDLLTGWVDISKYEGVTSPDYRVFVLNDKNGMCPEYYLYMMQMCYSARIFYGLGQGVSGMGRWRLQADKFLNFHIPIPPYDEQKIIADYITDKVNHIEVEIDKRNKLIEKYQEYKKSLIYEVVTGKKEV